eukprot:GHVQ01013976.1.p1 GENE.GHVQ01013976.1~~GHVQ01013976.1.p1  ORF type:complete len:817 (+),score=100.74 GHVQ01013976.1:404-2854(+)
MKLIKLYIIFSLGILSDHPSVPFPPRFAPPPTPQHPNIHSPTNILSYTPLHSLLRLSPSFTHTLTVVQVCLGADPSATNPYRDSKYFVDQPLSLAAISQDGGVAAVHRSFRRLMYWLQGGSRHPLHVESLLLRCVDEPNFAIRLGGPIREFVSRYFLDPEEGISRYTVGKEAAVSLDSSGKYSEQLQSGTRRRWNWEGFVNSSTLLSDEDRYVGRRAIEVLGGLVRNSNVSQVGGRVERDWLRVAETQRRSKEGNASKGVDNVESAEEVSKIGSAISLPLPFAVPGERFREMYYWDSYWIVRGLLLSGQLEAAQNIVQNFAWSIDRFGFIPNGFRQYYLDRSQPPLFFLMVRDLYDCTRDEAFLMSMYWRVKKEYEDFWMDATVEHSRLVRFSVSRVAAEDAAARQQPWRIADACRCCDYSRDSRLCCSTVCKVEEAGIADRPVSADGGYVLFANSYSSAMDVERPESFKEDWTFLLGLKRGRDGTEENMRRKKARDIRAAAESGWDFSSRWIECQNSTYPLGNIDTLNVVPVDLNSILWLTETMLEQWARRFDEKSVSKYLQASQQRAEMMNLLMWDRGKKRWADYLIRENRMSSVEIAAAFWPLWAGINVSEDDGCAAVTRLMSGEVGLLMEYGLAATNTLNTGHQWDAPNSWPPLTQIALEYLIVKNPYCGKSLTQKARHLLSIYVTCAALGLRKAAARSSSGEGWFAEKYDSSICGQCGEGGEYECQQGFGWTAGVILELLLYKSINFTFTEQPAEVDEGQNSAWEVTRQWMRVEGGKQGRAGRSTRADRSVVHRQGLFETLATLHWPGRQQ